MKSETLNPKSETNPKSKFAKLKTLFDYLNFGNSKLFRIPILDIRIFAYVLSFSILLSGCDAFVRKFTRKPNKENTSQEEMVLVPEEYKGPNMSKEELYRQYFLFWKSWSDELMEALMQGRSQKKQLDCAQEAIKNLENLKALLSEDAQRKLDIYIGRLNDLKNAISRDLYGNNSLNNAHDAERLKIDILQKFSYDKIKNNLP